MGRVAIIGDIGGHWDELYAAVVGLGADPDTLVLPADLTVCQVGDLVHRGPESEAVIQLVDQLLAANGERWVQLAGNHEAQYLFPPKFVWHEVLSAAAIDTLHRWWDRGALRLAAAFTTAGVEVRRPGGSRVVVGSGDLLVTHAGLTAGLWARLGSPASADAAADAVNAQRFEPGAPVWVSGRLLTRALNHAAGVVWAEEADELFGSWRSRPTQVPVPRFHQAHGHTSSFDWSRQRWRQPRLKDELGDRLHADPDTRVVRCEIGDQVIWGCDPGHGQVAAPRWRPLVLETAG